MRGGICDVRVCIMCVCVCVSRTSAILFYLSTDAITDHIPVSERHCIVSPSPMWKTSPHMLCVGFEPTTS